MHWQSSLVVTSQRNFTTRVTIYESSMALFVRAIYPCDPSHDEGNDIERSVTIKSLLSYRTIGLLQMNL